jgi:selenide,water dikinase
MEDAAVLHPENGPGFVFTVDFITPIVDDPATFGAIAAANSISDVYAMGGEPQAALAICGFPSDRVSLDVVTEIFQGGRDKAAEAGCAIVGGHTVIDPELKYGLCVLGSVERATTLSHTGAKVGDRLVLTKPIGTGISAQAVKKDRITEAELSAVIESMLTLNRGAKDAALAAAARAATDITGFGLLGHLYHLLMASKVAAQVHARAVPIFPHVLPLAAEGIVPGGTKRNLAYVTPHARWDDAIDEAHRLTLCDAQTSGGLLVVVPRDGEGTILRELERAHTPARAVIGEIIAGEPGTIRVTAAG